MTLRETQTEFHAAVIGAPSPDERIAIYQRAYRLRVLETLHRMFPRLLRALGEPMFDDFALTFLREEPPRGWTLDRLAETFPQWLERTSPQDEEWAERIVSLARREARATRAAMCAAAI